MSLSTELPGHSLHDVQATDVSLGPKPAQWNNAMEHRIKEYFARGMDANSITNELFDEFATPQSGYWQETYKKM